MFEVSSSVRLANMADRKSRSVTFKVAFQVNVGVLKIGIERVTSEEITVFQNMTNFWSNLNRRMRPKLLLRKDLMSRNFMFVVTRLRVIIRMSASWVSVRMWRTTRS